MEVRMTQEQRNQSVPQMTPQERLRQAEQRLAAAQQKAEYYRNLRERASKDVKHYRTELDMATRFAGNTVRAWFKAEDEVDALEDEVEACKEALPVFVLASEARYDRTYVRPNQRDRLLMRIDPRFWVITHNHTRVEVKEGARNGYIKARDNKVIPFIGVDDRGLTGLSPDEVLEEYGPLASVTVEDDS
jgi:hypothetical protein